jgi:LmbE family N-acetylglucosaminyl deacetylase
VSTSGKFNIVFVVCHPDDEALWTGGLLCELSRLSFVKAYVVCLSGRDRNSPRAEEFEAARLSAGYAAGIVLGGPLRKAGEPLPPTPITLCEGLEALCLTSSQIDILVTHSPYGDEHKNPHHIQTYFELKAWCQTSKIPFGYFSCIPFPSITHVPVQTDLRRSGSFQLLNHSICGATSPRELLYYRGSEVYTDRPRHYLQFLTDGAAKARMLACYKSIDVPAHQDAYTMFTNPCEAIYLDADDGLAPWLAIFDHMTVPGAPDLMRIGRRVGVGERATRKLTRLFGLQKST